jgi:hypothetical protein
MKHLKRLALSFVLMSVLSVAAFAGETPSPPCAPGETTSPPCAVQSVNEDSAVPGETHGPPALPAVDMTDISEAVLWALLLF